MFGVEQAVPSKLIDSKPTDIDTDVKRMMTTLLSYISKVDCKFCAKKNSYQ